MTAVLVLYSPSHEATARDAFADLSGPTHFLPLSLDALRDFDAPRFRATPAIVAQVTNRDEAGLVTGFLISHRIAFHMRDDANPCFQAIVNTSSVFFVVDKDQDEYSVVNAASLEEARTRLNAWLVEHGSAENVVFNEFSQPRVTLTAMREAHADYVKTTGHAFSARILWAHFKGHLLLTLSNAVKLGQATLSVGLKLHAQGAASWKKLTPDSQAYFLRSLAPRLRAFAAKEGLEMDLDEGRGIVTFKGLKQV